MRHRQEWLFDQQYLNWTSFGCHHSLQELLEYAYVENAVLSEIHVGSSSLLADNIFLALCILAASHSAESSPNRAQPLGSWRSLRYTMLNNINFNQPCHI
jgi:hypothetical protein